jgi:hypothetical protein
MGIPYPGDEGFERFKLFPPPDTRTKYWQPPNSNNHLYFPPGIEKTIGDISVNLYIVEGEKKCLKANQEGIPCVGIGGLWNWSNGQNELIEDFDRIETKGRRVIIVPDSDWKSDAHHYTNGSGGARNLLLAVERLGERLRDRGAKTLVVNLPAGPNGQKVGLDDYLNLHSVDEFLKLPRYELNRQKNKRGQVKTQFEIALELASDQLVLFNDRNKDGFVFFNGECIPLRSKKIKQWLSRQVYLNTGKPINSDAENQVIKTLEGMAIFDHQMVDLQVRIASKDGAIWYDIGDRRVARITSEGWTIIDAPILFRRYAHQQVQISPVLGGDPWQFFKFVNVAKENQLLVLVYIISCFIPDIPHPIFNLHGSQGSGKTTFSRLVKRITDPSSTEAIIHPRDATELVQQLAHHHFIVFDNLSGLPDWMSDILAQACTGSGFSKRQLYTDDDDVIYSVKRCIGLNGINQIVGKPDLMDRCILLSLERIDPERRMEEAELWRQFDEIRPLIFGGILDTISRAMRIYPEVKLPFLYRMADFTRWGYAIAEALGRPGKEFLDSYQGNVERQTEEVIQRNTLAQALISFMANREKWSGHMKEAFEELQKVANPGFKDRTFPTHPNKLRNHLKVLESTLRDQGITFQIGNHSEDGTPIVFQKKSERCSGSSVSSDEQMMNSNDLKSERNVPKKQPDGQRVGIRASSGVSSSYNFSKPLNLDDSDNPEDPSHGSWSGLDFEKDEVEITA